MAKTTGPAGPIEAAGPAVATGGTTEATGATGGTTGATGATGGTTGSTGGTTGATGATGGGATAGGQALTGDALRQFLRTEANTIRSTAGIRAKDSITTSSDAMAAQRYFGKQLSTVAQTTAVYFADVFSTGAFVGLGFTPADYNAALALANDKATTETATANLAADAHADAVAARADLADKTMQIVQSHRAMVNSPGTSPGTKAVLKEAGGPIEGHLQALNAERKVSRDTNSELRSTKQALSNSQSTNQQYQTQETVANAQKDLRIQYLQGEQLRPEDLVMAPAPASPAASKRPGKGVAQPAAAPASGSPAPAKGRRKSQRG